MRPPDHVLDLFAVPDVVTALPGGQGASVLAGDLVLSPGRDEREARWLSPLLARLAVELDTRHGRRRRDLRLAMPVPARDGSWVVEGWAASRYEPGTRGCRDLAVLRAAGALLHAEFALACPTRPEALAQRQDRWAAAADTAFAAAGEGAPTGALVTRLLAQRTDSEIGPAQLVHGDLAGNVLLDDAGAPVVIDVAPYWRPALWAEAVCVLDAVRWLGADAGEVAGWRVGRYRQAMVRAALFRLLSDETPDVAAYQRMLSPLLDSAGTGSFRLGGRHR